MKIPTPPPLESYPEALRLRYAMLQLQAGKTPAEVLHAPLRTMQDDIQPQQEAQPPHGAK